VCGRGSQQAHQLFQQAADGTFRERAAATGLDPKGDGLSTWLDAEGDGDMDLFWTTKREAWLYRNENGHFDAESVGTLRDRARQISKADYDGDGDVDIYLAAQNGSSLLIAKRGDFEIVEPERLGLPHDAACGNWVDYNNDGIQDLHVLPGGIFEQRADHKFYPTGLLGTAEPPSSAFCIWFDANNDGYRDLLVAVPRKQTILEKLRAEIARRIGLDRQVWISQEPYLFFLQGVTMGHPFFRPEIWDLTLYRAIGGDRHWLELSLAGPKANRSALGASVRVRTASATQAQAVGHAEGSLRSSGHYRVYFGLGDQERIDSVQLAWPDGRVQEIDRVAPDRLMTIQQESKD
jgi:ASPIC and UnbV/FG-GAP-like repeat